MLLLENHVNIQIQVLVSKMLLKSQELLHRYLLICQLCLQHSCWDLWLKDCIAVPRKHQEKNPGSPPQSYSWFQKNEIRCRGKNPKNKTKKTPLHYIYLMLPNVYCYGSTSFRLHHSATAMTGEHCSDIGTSGRI